MPWPNAVWLGRLLRRGAAGHPAADHQVDGTEAPQAAAIGLPVPPAAAVEQWHIVAYLPRVAAAVPLVACLLLAAAVVIGPPALPAADRLQADRQADGSAAPRAADIGLQAALPAAGSDTYQPGRLDLDTYYEKRGDPPGVDRLVSL